ncbi:MAG TPA: hypothetical protein VG942_00445 [Hyphomonadaceae bacterium]|nr:hypothetical protein [Hyphomonadaceae bacterium]
MRDLIGLVIGLYLTVALVVFGGAAYGFISGEQAQFATCARPGNLKVQAAFNPELAGGPNWIPWALYRAIAWPKTYFDDIGKTDGLVDWLMVHYNPFPETCK